MSGEEREEVMQAVALRSLADTSQQAQRSSVIFFATGIINLTSQSNVVEENSIIDLTTPPPSPSRVADETLSVEGSLSPSSSSTVNGSKTAYLKTLPFSRSIAIGEERTAIDLTTPPPPSSRVADETLSVEGSLSPSSSSTVNGSKTAYLKTLPFSRSIAIGEERRAIDLTTPPPPSSSVADDTMSVERSPSPFLSFAANVVRRTKQIQKAIRNKCNLWRLVRMYRGKRRFCCDKCQFKTQYWMPMRVHLDSHKLRRLNKRKTCTNNKVINPTGQLLEVTGSRTENTKNDKTKLSDSEDQDAGFEGSTKNLCENNSQTVDTPSEKDNSVENIADSREENVQNMHQCDICGYKAWMKLEVLKHDKDYHKKLTTYYCSDCSYETANKRKLIRHCATHIKQNRLIQSKSTVNRIHVTQPKTISGAVKLYKCMQCDYKCKQKGSLNRHMRKHTNEKPLQCERCVSRFTWKYQLDKHMVDEHSVNKLLFNCGQCDYKTARKGMLIRHERIHSGEKPFQCSQCDFRAAQKASLITHKRIHSGEKPFQCSQCDFKAAHKGNLITHKRIHSGEKPFQCSQCDFRAAQKGSLITHKRIHSGEKPFQCSQCDFKAAHKGNLITHKRIHSGDKPNHCKKCEFKTAWKVSLVIHERIHSGDKPFHCSQCDFSAIHKVHLTRHIQRIH